MALEVELIEGRLKSFMSQLQAESGILERIVYKNKNQHRRCSYFQYLLKVRRNLKLLHSINLEELLDSCFNVITGRKAKAKAHFLETLKRRKCDNGNFNFMERLMGVARLLSEMVEPILKTATEISTLLARTFFMGFSIMILALLGRLRVLVQQMLLDVVSMFNEVASLAQKKQSIKINQDGIEVFREYYPMMEEVVTLDCVWETDKFALVEKTNKVDPSQGESLEPGQILKTSIKYRSIGISLEDGESDTTKNDDHESDLSTVSNGKRKRSENDSENVEALIQNVTVGDKVDVSSSTSIASCSNKKVAFVCIAKPAPKDTNAVASQENELESKMHVDKENPLFSLFGEDDTKDSFF